MGRTFESASLVIASISWLWGWGLVQRERNGEAQGDELGYVCRCSYTQREFDGAFKSRLQNKNSTD